MRHVKWSLVGSFVALALGVGALVQAQQQLSGEYKIGVLEPLTGNLAAEGKRHLEGYEIMRDLINDRFGGVMGKKLVFVTGDAVDPTVAASEATRLATREGVKIRGRSPPRCAARPAKRPHARTSFTGRRHASTRGSPSAA